MEQHQTKHNQHYKRKFMARHELEEKLPTESSKLLQESSQLTRFESTRQASILQNSCPIKRIIHSKFYHP
uniref:Uncharacterized protein n=1 Tax=Rhizophora mucronata TaxID=61149 RepID=A0A2P2Q502_RHIMU